MTRITDVLDRVARRCSVPEQSSWLSATNTAALELRDDYLPQCADELVKRHDWASPISKQQTITGSGLTNYNLNANFKRLSVGELAIYETTTTRRKVIPVTSDGDWTYLNDIGTASGNRYYRIKGYPGTYTIDFYRAPATGDSIVIHYVSNIWMKNSGGAEGSAFTQVNDVLLFPRRLTELYMIFQFRKDHGLDFANEESDFERFMATELNRDRGIKKIIFGAKPNRSFTDIPVPDFIPSL